MSESSPSLLLLLILHVYRFLWVSFLWVLLANENYAPTKISPFMVCPVSQTIHTHTAIKGKKEGIIT